MKISYWVSEDENGKKIKIKNSKFFSDYDKFKKYNYFYFELDKLGNLDDEKLPIKEYKDIVSSLNEFFTQEKYDEFFDHLPKDVKKNYTQNELEQLFFELVKTMIFFKMNNKDMFIIIEESNHKHEEHHHHHNKLISLGSKENVIKVESLIEKMVISINDLLKLF